jgi:hypothetical protein
MLKFDAENVIKASSDYGMCEYELGFKNVLDKTHLSECKDEQMIKFLQHKKSVVAMFALSRLSNTLGNFVDKKLSPFEISLFKSLLKDYT